MFEIKKEEKYIKEIPQNKFQIIKQKVVHQSTQMKAKIEIHVSSMNMIHIVSNYYYRILIHSNNNFNRYMNSSPCDSYAHFCDLVSTLHLELQKSKGLKQQLSQKNVSFQLKNMDVSFLDDYFSHRKHTPQEHRKLTGKLEWEIKNQIQQQQEMEKLVIFERKREIAEKHEKEVEIQEAIGEYMFLRSSWLHFKWDSSSQVDDRMDRLNKMISMMRGNVAKRIAKEKKEGEDYAERREDEMVLGLEYHRKYENLLMEKEDLLVRLCNSEQQINLLKNKNNELQQQISRQKAKVKELQQNYMVVSNKNLLERKSSYELQSLHSLPSSIKQIKQQAQVYKYFNYVISITGKNIQPKQVRVKRTLDEVREFLVPEKKHENQQGLAHSFSSNGLNKSVSISESMLQRVVSNVKFERIKIPGELPRYPKKKDTSQTSQECILE